MYDELTKVYNRHYFEVTMPEIFNKSNRSTDKFSLVFIDVNNLKEINDKFGHNTGDELIIAISRVLKEMTREDDFVARFGGDEFVIYANKTDCAGAESLIKRIKEDLKLRRLKHCNQVKLSIAAGIATYPEDGKTYQELLKTADQRMYLDKKQEKVINPNMRRKSKKSM
jgi:diguanylate cyclase (GGDEF)-like protein